MKTLKDLSPKDLQSSQNISAVYLTEAISEINEGAHFLDTLSLDEIKAIRQGTKLTVKQKGESVFTQGERHSGIYLIESGRVRTFYTGPSGKEIMLALWTEGHFIGGPEVFGGGVHMWTGVAETEVRLRFLNGQTIRNLIHTMPSFALCLIHGLVAKGKCYSALVQMLGTRSVVERLAQLLLILGGINENDPSEPLTIKRSITHEQLANIVGSTRQWVTSTLSRFQKQGLISIEKGKITVLQPESLTFIGE